MTIYKLLKEGGLKVPPLLFLIDFMYILLNLYVLFSSSFFYVFSKICKIL